MTPTAQMPAEGRGPGKVLLIEDEPGIVDFIRRGLEAEGFTVAAETDGVRGEARALRESVDLVVLDMLLPGRGGLEVLASLRSGKPEVPVIVLTAKGEVEDRVAGLDAGAVDYMVKPFSMAELCARIRARLRALDMGNPTRLRGEGIEIDLLTRSVSRGGEQLALTGTEFEVLAHLMRNRDRVVPRDELRSVVWGYRHDPMTNIVDVFIGYLRRKLRRPGDPAPIQTVRSVGYRFGHVGPDGDRLSS